ncbi:MAG: 2-amino-4-oxopentanoate thiolase subunit OrtA [Candidatus Izemoplasmatales bacterium]|nr:2-amino-4-oxopentanoate thiolase subunit OrtA [Candidatus Izemoplasmatales bacterium]
MIKQGTWVQIQSVILLPEYRAKGIPEDTSKTPLLLWVKGTLLDEAKLGDIVRIQTITGRIETGTLLDASPAFHHDFGDDVPELREIDQMVRRLVFGGDVQ